MKKRAYLGEIATAHGVRGLIKVRCEADDPHLLDQHGPLYTSETGSETITLTMKNSMGKYWLAKVTGVADRDAALALHGTQLWIDRDKLPVIENDGTFYIDDLTGLKVLDSGGTHTGEIISVGNFGAGDLLEIKPLQGNSFYVLFNEDNVTHVSLDNGTITVIPHE